MEHAGNTARLRLVPLTHGDLAVFHSLVTDPHVRRYLLDGQTLPLDWSEGRIDASAELFAETGLGLWLARTLDADEVVGFCGFMRLPGTGLDLELVYALREAHTGRGLATEMGAAMLARAASLGLDRVHASVDSINAASVRVLERLGFALDATAEGAFGDLLVYRRDLGGA
jgi:[ribosomal protein S5]-alanine N-acetyltransferase